MAAPMLWRLCPQHPTFEVSEHGDVRRVGSKKRLRGFIDADGYVRYSLTDAAGVRRAIGAHRLVAFAFIGPQPSPQHEVAHNNGSRLACHFSNLRWALPASNQHDKLDHGTSAAGERNSHAKITEADVQNIRRAYREIKQPGSGRSVGELDRKYGLCRGQIIRIARGQAWSHIPMPNFEEAA